VTADTELRTRTAIVLVGDRFQPFRTAGLGMTAADFAAAVAEGEYDGCDTPVCVHVGQGVDEGALECAAAAIDHRNLGDRLLLRRADLPTPIASHAVHKQDPRNVLVADLEQTGPNAFEAAMRIHNDNELATDHQSSLHIQGMILVEAARQMFLAVCEVAYLRHWSGHEFAFLLTAIDTKFKRPVYPMPVHMSLVAHRVETSNINRIQFDVETRFLQAGQEAAAIAVRCAVRPAELSQRGEVFAARAAATRLSNRTD
jgi:hypothetical protein